MKTQKHFFCDNSLSFATLLCLVSTYAFSAICIGHTSSATDRVENNVGLSNLVSKIILKQTTGFSSSIKTNSYGDITSVALYGPDISQTNIALVASIPTLEALCLGCCTNEINVIDEHAFISLKQSKRLMTLEIYGGVPLLTVNMCKAISSLTMLRNLKIEFCPIEGNGKNYLLQMKNLINLKLPDESQGGP